MLVISKAFIPHGILARHRAEAHALSRIEFLGYYATGGTAERVTNFVQVFRNQSGGIAERDLKNGLKL
jgi:hypothetical protein